MKNPDMRAKSSACDILVTGFGRYPGVRHNPTAVLAMRVSQQLGRAGIFTRALVMPVSYGTGLALLTGQVAQLQPRAILMLGLAARSRWFRAEMFARSSSSPLHADASGRVPRAAPSLVLSRRSTARPDIALAILRANGARARLSASAGRYLCNASYALALETASPAPVLFIHIPQTAQWQIGGSVLVRALAKIGRQMIVQARRR
jgi:pyroglutamyl-peptidase